MCVLLLAVVIAHRMYIAVLAGTGVRRARIPQYQTRPWRVPLLEGVLGSQDGTKSPPQKLEDGMIEATAPLPIPVHVRSRGSGFVAVCAATRSRLSWTKLDMTDPGRVLLPSIAATTTKADKVRVFLGVDSDDRFWVPWRNAALVSYANDTWKLDVTVFTYARHENHVPFNALMRDAYDLGAEYLVRVNDDSEFETRGWVSAARKVLQGYQPPNVGVVGPVCLQGNTRILTHDMVHRTHLDIFQAYYPPQFSNWYVDDWISRVYGPSRTTKLKTWTVKHHLTPTRYQPVVSDKIKLSELLANGNEKIENYMRNQVSTAPKYAIYTTSDASHLKKYERNLNTMRCYEKSHSDYELAIFSKSDTHLQHGCGNYDLMFLRHCMLSNYLDARKDIMAVLVLDSDNAILDTSKRFESLAIKDLNFEIRFHNGEIAASPLILRNTNYTIKFLREWGNMKSFPFNSDNGALHQMILTRLGAKDRCVEQSKHYGEFRHCFVGVVNERNCDYDFFKNHATVAFPLHTFSYDGWLTKYRYSDKTFIHHAMKNPPIGGENNGRLMPDVWKQDCKLDKEKDAYHVSVTEEDNILHSKIARASTHRWLEGGMTLSSCLNVNEYETTHGNRSKTTPALRIIVLTMNRAESLLRLLKSLSQADYENDSVDLDVWIDIKSAQEPANAAVVKVCRAFEWTYGRKSIHIHDKPAGLRGQWLYTWNHSVAGGLTAMTTEKAVILEDDLEVSPFFWRWLKVGHREYEHRSDIAGFSLNRLRLCPRKCNSSALHGGAVPDNTNFRHTIVGPWGFSPTVTHWINFTRWAKAYQEHESVHKPYVEGILMTAWYKMFRDQGRCPGINCMWTQLHHYYTSWAPDKWVVWAKCEHGTALAINHQEKGLHFGRHMGPDAALLTKKFPVDLTRFPVDSLIIDLDGRVQHPAIVSFDTVSGLNAAKKIYFLHLHKSGGTSVCSAALANGLNVNRHNCNVQADQRCCGGETVAEQQQFARKTTYDFVACESYMYAEMDLQYYTYVTVLRSSMARYMSHYNHVMRARQTESFDAWLSGQPDNWNVRHICGTRCMHVPKFALSSEDFHFAARRLSQFSHILFFDTLRESSSVMADKLKWKRLTLQHHQKSPKPYTYPHANWTSMTCLDDLLYQKAKENALLTIPSMQVDQLIEIMRVIETKYKHPCGTSCSKYR